MIAVLLGLEDERVGTFAIERPEPTLRMPVLRRLRAQAWTTEPGPIPLPEPTTIEFAIDRRETACQQIIDPDVCIYRRKP